ncbi:unnamed protein product [Mytilus coruscus]|uniref:Integrase catalytic domain-containing protein n=1 Tax=Mytilus coruscus TaxID=42192 RepID=A0A6J8ECP6_MYTCO|nr:unnamed protein product [Mytilus coruscus]
MNPVFNGNVSRCKICDSKFHWVKDCPHKQLGVNLTEHETQEFKPLTVFVAEAYNAAVIDTACSKTVCGSKWLYEFVESLDPGLDQITCFESHVPFKFGDGQTVYSYQKVIIPALIGSVKCSIETEVVDSEIPLLLSKTSLKRASIILDLSNCKVTMLGQLVDDEPNFKCRLSAAAIIRRKDSKVIVDKFMQIWVGVYGAPEVGVYTDNGGEFNSQIFRHGRKFEYVSKTTAGYTVHGPVE